MLGIGGNAKLDEFRAAMGICNLRRMEECIKKRKAIVEAYDSYFKGVPGLTIQTPNENVIPNYAYYPLYIDKEVFGKSRDDIFNTLTEYNIYARKYFYPAINEMTCYKDIFPLNTPIAHDVSRNILTLPLYEELTLSEVDKISNIILNRY